jgi:hypothetical protein
VKDACTRRSVGRCELEAQSRHPIRPETLAG